MLSSTCQRPCTLPPTTRRTPRCIPQATLDYKPVKTLEPQQNASQPVLGPKPDWGGAGQLRATPTSPPIEQEHHKVWATAAAERALAASLLGLGCVAFDVFSPSSLHLLAAVDAVAHAWVVEHMPPGGLLSWVARYLVSNAAIVAGLLGWAGAAVYAAWGTSAGIDASAGNGRDSRTSHALLLAALAYGVAGAYKGGDALAIDLLKNMFHRLRPAAHLHHTFSFPSGHTTAAVFITGTLLLMLLPVAFGEERQWRQQQQQQQLISASSRHEAQALHLANAHSGSAVSNGSASPAASGHGPEQREGPTRAAGAQLAPWQEALLRHRLALWAGAALLTASGRILANAHWATDTLGGMCLGCALVSSTILIWNWLAGGGERERQ